MSGMQRGRSDVRAPAAAHAEENRTPGAAMYETMKDAGPVMQQEGARVGENCMGLLMASMHADVCALAWVPDQTAWA